MLHLFSHSGQVTPVDSSEEGLSIPKVLKFLRDNKAALLVKLWHDSSRAMDSFGVLLPDASTSTRLLFFRHASYEQWLDRTLPPLIDEANETEEMEPLAITTFDPAALRSNIYHK